jgi:hypothetical protein
MKIQKYTFMSVIEDEEGEPFESCRVQTCATDIGDIMRSFRMLLLGSGFSPNNIDDYITLD